MTILCGWSGLTADPAARHGMLDACDAEPRRHAGHERGFCATAGRHTWLVEARDCLVSIAGRPRWKEEPAFSAATIEALLEDYRIQGPAFLGGLKGEFALAIEDLAGHSLLLAVDRVGSHPLAYQGGPDGVVYASSLNMLRHHPAFVPDIDPQAIFDYLYFHMIPSPGCIYRNTVKLEPAQYACIHRDRIETGYYWQPDYRDSARPKGDLATDLRRHLDSAVRHSLDDRPIGTFLSGGLDSSTVTGVYQQQSASPVSAFSIGFRAEGYDETPFAEKSARHFGAHLQTYYVTPEDVVSAIPMLAAHFDEPFGNASAIPAYYCARFAGSLGIDCLLAGDGGDELFAGNARYAKQKVFAVYDAMPGVLRRGLIEPFALHLPQAVPLLRKVRSYVEQARTAMPARMETYNFLHRSPLQEIFTLEFLEAVDTDNPLANIRDVYMRTPSDSMLKRMLYMDMKITLADNDLRKVRQSCAIAGMEVRFPMLDDDIVAFSAGIPDRLLMQGFELRSFYRRALADFLPPATLDKTKHGFGLPFGVWMTQDHRLRELACDSLADFRGRGYMRGDYIDRLIDAHRGSHSAYYGVMIWVVMMLEQWLQRHETAVPGTLAAP